MITLVAALALLSPASIAAREHRLEPELLTAIAYVESRHQPDVVSAVRGRAFCGVMQTRALDARHCLALRSELLSYREGARILNAWLRACGGSLECALGSYGCGFAARAKCSRFAARVIGRRDRLRRAAQS